ncbi:Na+/H+ antiporter NhaC family protein, partial [Staphylococcus epidermidis]|uniref:Na+/H+ antiporter NhaC family protein n=1 Tax=Staphylococcus epidermidis TaxID=1282 RepID=UPI0037D9F1E1
MDEEFVDGVKLMGYIGVVIVRGKGFGGVMNGRGDIDRLVKSLRGLSGNDKLISISWSL